MTKSFKKIPIAKLPGELKEIYHRIIRRKIKQDLKLGKELKADQEIINDSKYVDYVSRCAHGNECLCIKLYGRMKCINK